MKLSDIWLQIHGGDFATGVALLKKHNPSAVTSRIMIRLQETAITGAAPNEYERGKLFAALEKTPAPKPSARETVPNPSAPDPVRTTIVPAAAKTSEAAKRLHKEHAHVHAQMVTSKTDTDRAGHAREIMETIVPELDKEYDRLRGGQPGPETGDTTPAAGAALLRELHSIRTRIAKIKKLLKVVNTKARTAELEKELAEKTSRKEKLEADLA